jgi:hypothetical protein
VKISSEALNIYVLKELSGKLDIVDGNNIFVTENEVVSGEYRHELIASMMKMDRGVLVDGLESYIFNEKVDKNYIKKELADNLDVLDLFYGRTNDNFNTKDEIKLYRNVLNDISKKVIKEKGIKNFLKENISDKEIAKYAKGYGIKELPERNNKYTDDNLYKVRKFTLVPSEKYSMIVRNKGVSFYFDKNIDWMENISDIANMLVFEDNTRASMKEFFQREGLKRKRTDMNVDGINYMLKKSEENGFAKGEAYKSEGAKNPEIHIYADGTSILTHEMAHIFLFRNSNNGSDFLNEGLAEYFGSVWNKTQAEGNDFKNIMNAIPDDEKYKTEEFKEYYIKKTGSEVNDTELDNQAIFDYWSYKKVKNNIIMEPIVRQPVGNCSGTEPGDELTYVEAESFANYLIEKYSINKVINFLWGEKDYEKYFGNSYEELKQEWINSISII